MLNSSSALASCRSATAAAGPVASVASVASVAGSSQRGQMPALPAAASSRDTCRLRSQALPAPPGACCTLARLTQLGSVPGRARSRSRHSSLKDTDMHTNHTNHTNHANHATRTADLGSISVFPLRDAMTLRVAQCLTWLATRTVWAWMPVHIGGLIDESLKVRPCLGKNKPPKFPCRHPCASCGLVGGW